ncbi:MAG: hypothetical protein WDO15_21975 [Bacteroidota bacterium]
MTVGVVVATGVALLVVVPSAVLVAFSLLEQAGNCKHERECVGDAHIVGEGTI